MTVPQASDRPALKFCGLVRAEDAVRAAELGAGFLGSIFAGGPREVTAEAARANLAAGRAAAQAAGLAAPLGVGVMAGQSPDAIARLADAARLDLVQLHADPDARHVAAVRQATGRPVWAVLRVAGVAVPSEAAALFAAADGVVLDARVEGRLGGTGVTLDWDGLADALARVRGPAPLVLAGGLGPDNVARAVAALAPDVVDVSSGVERAPGVKDHARMAAFAAAARGSAPAASPTDPRAGVRDQAPLATSV